MEVSDYIPEASGQELVETLITLTGLPDALIRTELNQILEPSGQAPETLTLDELRTALISYLEQMEAEFLAEEASLAE